MTDYQRGCVDTATTILYKRVHGREQTLPNGKTYPVDSVKDEMMFLCHKIIAENTPKKSEAEIFYDKHKGKMVLTRWRDSAGTLSEFVDGRSYKIDEGGLFYFCSLSDITHVYTPTPAGELE